MPEMTKPERGRVAQVNAEKVEGLDHLLMILAAALALGSVAHLL